MARTRKPTDAEKRLWRMATRDVTPFRPGTDAPPPPPPDAPKPPARSAPLPAAAPQPTAPASLPPLRPGDSPGVDRRTADRLRRGRLPIDGRLDLHGMTQVEAHDALRAFVLDGHRQGRRTLLVITGKGTFGTGGGVLRNAVPRWLNDAPLRDKVLSFTPAQAAHGGGGALYVLLRRRRD